MRGRKPKPLARQIAEGDPRKKGSGKLRQQLAAEPQPSERLPKKPPHLKGRAAKAWKFWAAELEDMNLSNRPDAMMLEGACINYARAVEADQLVAREGMIVEDCRYDEETKTTIVLKRKYHPGITVSNAAWRQVRAFCSEFGLSPVSRTRLAIDKPKKETEDLAKLLSRPRESRASVQ